MTLPSLLFAGLGPAIAGAVWWAGMLTAGGAIAAALLGSVAALAGPGWMVLLLSFFLSSVLLGRVGRERKRQRSSAIIGKSGARDAWQVLANGAVFTLGASIALFGGGSEFQSHGSSAAGALGALAAATADTWGTEIGMLSNGAPHSIITWAPLEPGMSGGVSWLGIGATLCGALALAGIAVVLRWPPSVAGSAAAGGVVGAVADSVLGATLQVRRRSIGTGRLTERLQDDDGTPTKWAGGLPWLDNDAVNFAATIIGAGTASGLHAMLSRIGRA